MYNKDNTKKNISEKTSMGKGITRMDYFPWHSFTR